MPIFYGAGKNSTPWNQPNELFSGNSFQLLSYHSKINEMHDPPPSSPPTYFGINAKEPAQLLLQLSSPVHTSPT